MSARALSRFDISRPPATKWTLIPILVVHWLGLLFIFPGCPLQNRRLPFTTPRARKREFFCWDNIIFSLLFALARRLYDGSASPWEWDAERSGHWTCQPFCVSHFLPFCGRPSRAPASREVPLQRVTPFIPNFFFLFLCFLSPLCRICWCHNKNNWMRGPAALLWNVNNSFRVLPFTTTPTSWRSSARPKPSIHSWWQQQPFWCFIYHRTVFFFFRKGRKKKRDATRPAAHEPCPGLECIISMFDDYVLGWTGCRWLRRHNPLSLEKDSSERRKFFPTIEEKKNALQWLLMAISRQRN